MNQIILDTTDACDPFNYLLKAGDYRYQHLQEILHAQIGDWLFVAVLNQGKGRAKIVEYNSQYYKLELNEPLCAPPLTRPFHLIIGLSRPPTLKKILEHGSCMGASSIHFVCGQLSDRSYLTSSTLREPQLTHLTHLGLAQSRHYFRAPSVRLWSSLNELLSTAALTSPRFVLSPDASATFKTHASALQDATDLTLAIGPERGWSAQELRQLTQTFTPIKISNTILRVEMALFAAMAQIELLTLDSSKTNCSSNKSCAL